MKNRFHILLGLLVALLPAVAFAQQHDRMFIMTKSGETIPVRTEHIDSIIFLTSEQNMTIRPTITPHSSGETGMMKLASGSASDDVAYIKVIIPESHRVAHLEGYKFFTAFTDKFAKRLNETIYTINKDSEYDLSSLQRGYKYTALFLAYDGHDCPAPSVYKLEFEVPNGPLKGSPALNITVSDKTYSGYKVKISPNSDVRGYYFFNDLVDNPDREQLMKQFGFPDLKHYVVGIGTEWKTRKAYQGEHEMTFNRFLPNTEYAIYYVMEDQNGQLSDVAQYKITTEKKGTSKPARVAIEIGEVTASTAEVTCKPDENCSIYRETIYIKEAGNKEDIINMLKNARTNDMQTPTHIDENSHKWTDLQSKTTYVAIAIAQNADGVWGEATTVEFTTK